MKTCIIQKNDAEESLIRFTEIGCLFNSENVWLDYFQNIIVTDDADSIQGPAWRINAGQYITTTVRDLHRDKVDVDLRKNLWSNVKELNKEGVTIILTTHYLFEDQELQSNLGIFIGCKYLWFSAKNANFIPKEEILYLLV